MAEAHKHIIDGEMIRRMCKGQPEAMEFFIIFQGWVHAIDDIVDGIGTAEQGAGNGGGAPPLSGETGGGAPPLRIPTAKDREQIVAAFAQGVIVLSHPFYLRNIAALRLLTVLIANQYADSVRWEKDDEAEEWQKRWADTHRSCGLEMCRAISLICGGWELVRSVSAELEEVCFWDHHDENGKQK
jgi:hypothetical protein